MAIKVQDLPTTTTGSTGDFIIKDKSAGGTGATQKISIASFITAFLQSLFDAKQNVLTSVEGITAYAGGGQANATELTASCNFVDTVASTNDSVKAISATVNTFQYIQNNGANDLQIYPQSGQNFVGESANAPLTISVGGQLTLACATIGVWRYFGASVPDATPTTKGKARLYNSVAGTNTDGAPDQNSVKTALELKADVTMLDEQDLHLVATFRTLTNN